MEPEKTWWLEDFLRLPFGELGLFLGAMFAVSFRVPGNYFLFFDVQMDGSKRLKTWMVSTWRGHPSQLYSK